MSKWIWALAAALAPSLLFLTTGGDGGGEGGDGDGGSEDGGGGDSKPVFTDEQQKWINDVLLKGIRAEAKKTAKGSLLKELGVDSEDDLKSLVGEAKGSRDANKTELEKVQAEIDKREKREAALKAHLAKQEVKLVAQSKGLDPEKVLKLIEGLGGMGRFEVDLESGEVQGVKDAIEALAELTGESGEDEGDSGNGDHKSKDPLKGTRPWLKTRSTSGKKQGSGDDKSVVAGYLSKQYKGPKVKE